MILLLFALAAAAGASIRYLAFRAMNGVFPYGTLAVNLAASFTLGALSQASSDMQTFVGIGGLGALSTWSAVANEAAEMARERQGLLAVLYLWATTTSGIVAAWIGMQVAGSY